MGSDEQKDRDVPVCSSAFAQEKRSFLAICERLDTPRSLACYLLARSDEWAQYLALPPVSFEIGVLNGKTLMTGSSFIKRVADDYLVSEMMTKNPALPNLSIDRAKVAKAAWLDAEASCNVTNNLIRAYRAGQFCFLPGTEDLISKAQSFIRNVLGDVRESLPYVQEHLRFGPGVTDLVKGSALSYAEKYSTTQWSISPNLLQLLPAVAPRGVVGRACCWNKVTFVPKNSKTDRPIGIEPHGSIFVQLGIGAAIRRRLRRQLNFDLNHQADRNRVHARNAFRCGYATIDLKSASDTIAYELVRLLVPEDWFTLLTAARSSHSEFDGELYRLAKFSSMGNGFTFELETLIFMSLAHACGSKLNCVFGDDIIVEKQVSLELCRLLSSFGFTTNEKKSFLEGNFYESCGHDFLFGQNIRPFYFKGRGYDATDVAIRIANAIRQYSHRVTGGFACDSRFRIPWLRSFERFPKAVITYVDRSRQDGIQRNFDEAKPHAKWRKRYHRIDYVGRARAFRRIELPVGTGALVRALHHSKEFNFPNCYEMSPFLGSLIRYPKIDGDTRSDRKSYTTEASRATPTLIRSGRVLIRDEWLDFGPWI